AAALVEIHSEFKFGLPSISIYDFHAVDSDGQPSLVEEEIAQLEKVQEKEALDKPFYKWVTHLVRARADLWDLYWPIWEFGEFGFFRAYAAIHCGSDRDKAIRAHTWLKANSADVERLLIPAIRQGLMNQSIDGYGLPANPDLPADADPDLVDHSHLDDPIGYWLNELKYSYDWHDPPSAASNILNKSRSVEVPYFVEDGEAL